MNDRKKESTKQQKPILSLIFTVITWQNNGADQYVTHHTTNVTVTALAACDGAQSG